MVGRTEPESGTSAGTRSALRDRWIDALFVRFQLMYGNAWADKWAGLAIGQVKTTWADDLSGCTGEQIRRALEHVKANNPFPPSCPEFLALCRQFRAPPSVAGYLKPPAAGGIPVDIQAEVSRLFKRTDGEKRDPKDWARRILANPERYPSISLEFASEAIGLIKPRGEAHENAA
jgi:hypothetical protein